MYFEESQVSQWTNPQLNDTVINYQPHQHLTALNLKESEVLPKQSVDFWHDIKIGTN